MEQLEVVFGLFVVLVVIATLARRIDVPYPILLVLGGLVIGLLPGLPRVELDPELVLLVFLPPLLYAAAIATPYGSCGRICSPSACSPSAWSWPRSRWWRSPPIWSSRG